MSYDNDYSKYPLPLISVVIPTHNRREKLARLIRSILESNYPKDKLEIIVVDDASTDDTCTYIKKLFPQIRIICNKDEKLVAESRNIGIRLSKGEYIFLIDDDNVIDKNTIKELVEFMEKHPEVGVAGPLMYFLSDPKRIWCAGIKRSYWTTLTKFICFNVIDVGQFKEPYECEDLPNAFMVRKEVFKKVGLFNSKLFPIHYEEADFCQRVRKAGYKVMVVPTARVWHDVPPPNYQNMHKCLDPRRVYYISRNRVIFHKLYSRNNIQRFSSLMFTLLIMITYYVPKFLIGSCDKKIDRILALMHGLMDGFKFKGAYYEV